MPRGGSSIRLAGAAAPAGGPYKRAAGEEKFALKIALSSKKTVKVERRLSASSRRPIGMLQGAAGLLLLLLLLLLRCCCCATAAAAAAAAATSCSAASFYRRADFIQDAQPAPQSFTRTLRRSLRVSATCRRGAAAYAVAFQCILEARMHGCLLYLGRYT